MTKAQIVSLSRFLSLLGGVSLVGSGCASEKGDDASGETDASTEGNDGPDPDGSASQSDTGVADTGSATTTATTATAGGSDGPVDPLPNGEECTSHEDCISMMCFTVGVLGGVCGECLLDTDCEGGGCSIPNPIADPPEGATCNMGEQGEGCMSSEVCAGEQVCAEILNVPGILVASTCSDCLEDADCGDQLCSPTYDVANLSGFLGCVDPGSVANGNGCDIETTGNEACENFCAPANVMGLLELGVCSECAADTDCADGEECEDATVDINEGLIPATCVPLR
jgi:hypothetical protein